MPRKRTHKRMNVASRPGSTPTSPNMLHVTVRDTYVKQAGFVDKKVALDNYGDKLTIRLASSKDKDVSFFRSKPDGLFGATFNGPNLPVFGTTWTDDLEIHGGSLCFPHPRLLERMPPKRTNKFMESDLEVFT